jgi:hypothetical protein
LAKAHEGANATSRPARSSEIARFILTVNGNATLDPPVGGGQPACGAALSGDIRLHDHWRVGARVEHLVISIEPRFANAQEKLFFTRSSPTDPSTGDRVANDRTPFGLVTRPLGMPTSSGRSPRGLGGSAWLVEHPSEAHNATRAKKITLTLIDNA